MVFSGSSLAAAGYWQQHYEEAELKYNENPESMANNYYKAIAMANLGMVTEVMEILDKFEDEFSKDEFVGVFNQEIEDIDEDKDELLYLNYHAFYHVIFDEYEEAIRYFDKIIDKDSGNIWPINYKSLLLIELERYNEASQTLNKSLSVQSNQYTYFLMALKHYEQGQNLRALNELRKTGSLLFKTFVGYID